MAQYQFLGFSKLRKFWHDLLFMAQYQFLGFSKLRKFRMVDQRASGSVNGVNMAGCPVLANFPAARFSSIFGVSGVSGKAARLLGVDRSCLAKNCRTGCIFCINRPNFCVQSCQSCYSISSVCLSVCLFVRSILQGCSVCCGAKVSIVREPAVLH